MYTRRAFLKTTTIGCAAGGVLGWRTLLRAADPKPLIVREAKVIRVRERQKGGPSDSYLEITSESRLNGYAGPLLKEQVAAIPANLNELLAGRDVTDPEQLNFGTLWGACHQDRQVAPRFAAAWDVNGNSTFKVFGTAGRYHLPLPPNVAVRGAGSSRFTAEFFTYTGVDPVTCAPTGLTSLGPVVSANNEFGQAIDPRQVAAKDIKAHYQDEFTLGFEKALTTTYNFGARVMYRDLKSTMDDMCDDRPFRAWAAAQPVPIDTSNCGGGCFLFNPGIANSFQVDLNGDGILENPSLSKEALRYDKAKRKYTALDLFLEHPLRDKWYGKINYTYSKTTGNTEGLLLSDIGQADVATTQVFDYPEIMDNASGRLPNDRKHQIKAYG